MKKGMPELQASPFLGCITGLFVVLPGGDADGIDRLAEECLYVGSGKTGVGQQGDVVVDCPAAYAVAVGELALGVVLGYVDYQTHLVA